MRASFCTPHTSVGEDKLHGLVEIALRQIADIRRVPVVDFPHAAQERLEVWDFLGSRRRRSLRAPA